MVADTDGEYAVRRRISKLWANIKRRCLNPESDGYSRYGARGIGVCQEWLDAPSRFTEWAIANGFTPGLEIDRIDNRGPYAPNNCRFVTRSQNCCNRSRQQTKKTSRFKGVYGLTTRRGIRRFRAKLKYGAVCIELGRFDSEEDAARAYDRAALEHFGEFARLNFSQEVASA